MEHISLPKSIDHLSILSNCKWLCWMGVVGFCFTTDSFTKAAYDIGCIDAAKTKKNNQFLKKLGVKLVTFIRTNNFKTTFNLKIKQCIFKAPLPP